VTIRSDVASIASRAEAGGPRVRRVGRPRGLESDVAGKATEAAPEDGGARSACAEGANLQGDRVFSRSANSGRLR